MFQNFKKVRKDIYSENPLFMCTWVTMLVLLLKSKTTQLEADTLTNINNKSFEITQGNVCVNFPRTRLFPWELPNLPVANWATLMEKVDNVLKLKFYGRSFRISKGYIPCIQIVVSASKSTDNMEIIAITITYL